MVRRIVKIVINNGRRDTLQIIHELLTNIKTLGEDATVNKIMRTTNLNHGHFKKLINPLKEKGLIIEENPANIRLFSLTQYGEDFIGKLGEVMKVAV